MNQLQELLQKKEQIPELQDPAADLIGHGVPTCGGNLESPVVDQAHYSDENTYRVGNRLYIEHADGGGWPKE